MKDSNIEITEEYIRFADSKKEVMHSWEDKLMKKKAEWVCQNGGDILELGFGMGISATYIQQHNIKSHTICEIHSDIIDKFYLWKEDKNNVTLIDGDWYDNIDKMGKYDGILYDTHEDPHYRHFFMEVVEKIAKPNCKITWWNNIYRPDNRRLETHINAEWEEIEVNPPQNTYFNNNIYYMPKYTHS